MEDGDNYYITKTNICMFFKIYGHLSLWDTNNIESTEYILENFEEFNININNWNTDSVTNICGIFHGQYLFNKPLK